MKTFGIRGKHLKEITQKILSIATISVGSWFIYDKVRTFIETLPNFDKWWWLFAIGLLYLGLVILDLDGNGS